MFEIVLPEAEQLHDAFERENEDEALVDPPEHIPELLGLVEVLDGHGHHVEEYEDHDEDVKLLARCYVEQDQLTFHLVKNV